MLMQGWAASMSTAVPADEKHPPLLPPWWTVAGKRLRVGFMSSEWEKNSPMMQLVDRLPILLKELGPQGHHSAVVVYNLAPQSISQDPSAGSRPSSAAISWSAGALLHGMDDFKAASTIASDRLHVVIDLTGYTAGGRPEILALLQNSRIVGSPLRMSYLGWPSTMGSTDVMDVAVGDAIATPIEIAANQYAEKLVIMPRSFFFADHDFKMRNVPHRGDGS